MQAGSAPDAKVSTLVSSGPRIDLRSLAPLWLSLATALVLRLPLLLRPDANSDAAVVGLQARHLLQGEWSKFLWGTPYRSSLDAIAAALGILLVGARPLALVLVPALAHLAIIALAWATLRPHLGRWTAALCTLPLIIPVVPLNTPITSATRQPCLLIIFAAIFLLDGARRSRNPRLSLALGMALAVTACGIDLFALQLLPGLLLLAICCAYEPEQAAESRKAIESSDTNRSRATALGAGLIIGALLLIWLRSGGESEAARLGLRDLGTHAALLRICLAFVLGAEPLGGPPPPHSWSFGLLQALRHAGGWLFLVGILAGLPIAIFNKLPSRIAKLLPPSRGLSWPVRRLGAFGALTALLTLLGFLLSPLSIDAWSARYLATLLLAAPFALAPLAILFRPARLSIALLPWAASALAASFFALGGLGGFRALPLDGVGPDEQALRAMLREEKLPVALAQYWVAYKLGYLFEESPAFAPLDPAEDRYPPYRAKWSEQQRFAIVIDPLEPRATEAALSESLHMQALRFSKHRAGRYVVLLVDRR